jgi:hypothetical protein
MSATMTKVMDAAITASWDYSIPNTKVYRYAYNRENAAGGIRKIRKDGWASAITSFKTSCMGYHVFNVLH